MTPPKRAPASAIDDLTLTRRTAHEQVAETLRLAILGGSLPPGTPLVISDLAARLGVSATPIREAIRDLAAEGLIDFGSYRSAVVHVPPPGEAHEVYELRLLLEPVAIRRAVYRIDEDTLLSAESLCETMAATDDVGLWVEYNRDFHRLLTDPADSPRLLQVIDELRNVAALHVTRTISSDLSQLVRSNQEHRKIVKAFRARDADEAVRYTEQHLRTTLQLIESDEARGAPSTDGDDRADPYRGLSDVLIRTRK